MEDWGRIAAIIAAATIPVYASPLILGPLSLRLKNTALQIYYRNTKCRGIRWEDLSREPLRMSLLPHAVGPGTALPDSPNIGAFAQLLHDVWGIELKPIARPEYLQVSREYIRLDADVLLTMLLLHRFGSGSLNRAADPGTACTVHLGTASIQLRVVERENMLYTIGTINGPPVFDLLPLGDHGITKHDLQAVAGGYPPFYRQFIWTNSNIEIGHPIQEPRDIYRAGWILVIGLSRTPPVRLYQTRQIPAYTEACARVLNMLELLQAEYASQPVRKQLLDDAVGVVTYMNGYRTGSGADALVEGTILLNGNGSTIGRRMTLQQLRFALKLFNDYRMTSLDEISREMLNYILEEVVRAAVHGIYTWWQYVNNEGHEFPGWLLDDRIRLNPIWIADG